MKKPANIAVLIIGLGIALLCAVLLLRNSDSRTTSPSTSTKTKESSSSNTASSSSSSSKNNKKNINTIAKLVKGEASAISQQQLPPPLPAGSGGSAATYGDQDKTTADALLQAAAAAADVGGDDSEEKAMFSEADKANSRKRHRQEGGDKNDDSADADEDERQSDEEYRKRLSALLAKANERKPLMEPEFSLTRGLTALANVKIAPVRSFNTSNPDFGNCVPRLGRREPPPLCTADMPCKNLMAADVIRNTKQISVPTYSAFRCSGLMSDYFGFFQTRFGAAMTKVRFGNLRTELDTSLYLFAFQSSSPSIRKSPLFFDDGPAKVIDIPNAYLEGARKRYYCQFVPKPPKKKMHVKKSGDDAAATSEGITSLKETEDAAELHQKEDDDKTQEKKTKKRLLPLVIFFPGSSLNASSPFTGTTLRAWAQFFGFAMVSVQALNRHWTTTGWIGVGESGTKFDYLFRSNISKNDDVSFADTLIDELIATGKFDRRRIYLLGGSNGMTFATFYAIMRSAPPKKNSAQRLEPSGSPIEDQPAVSIGTTPGGNKIAAVAGYSGFDPYLGVGWRPVCHTDPPPRSRVPVLMLSRLCDIVPCSWVRDWVKKLRTQIGATPVQWVLLDDGDEMIPKSMCNKAARKKFCSNDKDFWGHAFWPTKHERLVLEFLLTKTAKY